MCNDRVWHYLNNHRAHPSTTGWFDALPPELWTEHSAADTYRRATNPGDTGKIEVWIYNKSSAAERDAAAAARLRTATHTRAPAA